MNKSFSERSLSAFSSNTNNNYFQNGEFPTSLSEALRANASLIAIVFVFAVARIIFTQTHNVTQVAQWFPLFGMSLMTILFLTLFFYGRVLYIMIYIRPEQLTRYIWSDLRTNFLNVRRISVALPVYLLIPIFISTFSFFKSMIPVINPYSWDPAFMQLDGALHGGVQPWQLLQPLFGKPIITSVINFFYNLWFFVMYMVVLWQAFSMRDTKLRTQFFLTYTAAWIVLGNILAIIFSSAGPCYYGRITGLVDPFTPLMDYLRTASGTYPVWSLEIQELLWDNYVNGRAGLAKGISAMPSLHISMVTLFAIIGWKNGRIPGIVFSIFAIIIGIGSVHLGWHYAVDDYVAVVCTLALWKVTGYLTRRYNI